MTAIFREVVIEWDGKEYTVKPTFELICRVDNAVGLSSTAQQISIGEPRLTAIAKVASILLRHAGVDVTQEAAYLKIISGGQDLISQVATAIGVMLFTGDSGNDLAPKPATKAKAKK